jgi:lysophospholipase L1-like esterase
VSNQKSWRTVLQYFTIALVAAIAGVVGAEWYLSYRSAPRSPLPFYNRLYPYVMFRPYENYPYETAETYEMSHHKSRVFVYTNEDGFRVPSLGYPLPKAKPAGQLRIAVLGGSLVQLASTFDTTLPGSLRILLRKAYPGRDIEVINAGIQSSVSRQSIVQLLLTVVDYHPDMVILYDGGNDLGLPLTYESRPNFPYNFQTMEEAWDLYRQEREESLPKLLLHRSHLYRLLSPRFGKSQTKLAPTADAPFAGSNAVPASRIVQDREFVSGHVAAYLSNWRKLIELSAAYHFTPVCIESAVAGLDESYSVPLMMKSFRLDRASALEWVQAFRVLYGETARQIGELQKEHREVILLDLSKFLEPPDAYYWDLGHVYDEANMVIAERIYGEIKGPVERLWRGDR